MSLEQPYRAILLDLFWTTVDLDFNRFPKLRFVQEGKEGEFSSTGDLLFQAARIHESKLKRTDFLIALFALQKRVRQQWQDGVTEEISSQKKFADLLRTIPEFQNYPVQKLENLAGIFTEIHMQSIIESTVMPSARKSFLQRLQNTHSLALVSNFDHAISGYRILQVHGIADCFRKVVISDEWGKRKPHPELFERALAALGVPAHEALMVGDTPHADVAGAARLGLDTAWIQRPGEVWPERLSSPTYVLRDLTDLQQIPRISSVRIK